MWCSNCHQDVPGVAQAKNGRMSCSRCQRPLHSATPPYASKICDEGLALDEPAAAHAAAAPPLASLDWQSRERVRRLGRQLRRPPAETPSAVPEIRTTVRRFDPPQNLVGDLNSDSSSDFTPIATELTLHASSHNGRTDFGQVVSWLIVLAGVIALAGGLGIIGWSIAHTDMYYWNEALGLTLAGQGLLIFGLVLAVTRLWRSSRHASNKLHDAITRLAQLQRTADALAAMRSGGAPAFYADLVRGASPQALFANLKGQLDQLATRLGSGW
jgi:hypothetical protein